VSRRKKLQNFIRFYKDHTGEKHVDMRKVAAFAKTMGWPMPKPRDPLDILANDFADAAKEEYRHDATTGRSYRANHVIWTKQGDQQIPLYIDIDDDHPRHVIVKSVMTRREQVISDLVQIVDDAEHWSVAHPSETPIQIPLDFLDDVEWRRNADAGEKAS
jgi:hypothetical protein